MDENVLALLGGFLGGITFGAAWYLILKWRDKA